MLRSVRSRDNATDHRCEREREREREREIRAGEAKRNREEKQMRKEGGRHAAWKRALINLRTWKAAVQRDVAVPHLP